MTSESVHTRPLKCSCVADQGAEDTLRSDRHDDRRGRFWRVVCTSSEHRTYLATLYRERGSLVHAKEVNFPEGASCELRRTPNTTKFRRIGAGKGHSKAPLRRIDSGFQWT